MLDAVMEKPRPMLHIVGEREFLCYFFVRWRKNAMFANSHFGNAQSPLLQSSHSIAILDSID